MVHGKFELRDGQVLPIVNRLFGVDSPLRQSKLKSLSESNLTEILKHNIDESSIEMTPSNSTLLLQQNDDLLNDYSISSLLINESSQYGCATNFNSKISETNKVGQKAKDSDVRLTKLTETNQALLNKMFLFYHTLKVCSLPLNIPSLPL